MNISGHVKLPGSHFSPLFIENILSLIEDKGWANLELADLLSLKTGKEKESISVEDLRTHLSTKDDLIPLFQSFITEKLRCAPFDFCEDANLSEKLFEIIMRRFDVIFPFRRAFFSLQQYYLSSPTLMFMGFEHLQDTTKELFALAGSEVEGIDRWAFALSYGGLLKTWSADETPDLSTTMAQLDQFLTGFFKTAH